MGFLTGIEIRKAINGKQINIESLDSRFPFNLDLQVTEDAIDLRLAPIALKYKTDIKQIDPLTDDLNSVYELIEIPSSGYILKPGVVLFSQTLEAISFPDYLIGLVLTRSTYARMGIQTTCMAPKFATGISWAFPLQIANCNKIPIIIRPYAVVAQLIIAQTFGEAVGYQGNLQHNYTPIPPIMSDREKTALSTISADAAKRTFHILTKEIESTKKQIKDKTEEAKSEIHVENINIQRKSKLKVNITKSILGVLSALGFGILGNLLSAGNMDYWKVVSCVLLAIISIIFLIAIILISERLFSPGQEEPNQTDNVN